MYALFFQDTQSVVAADEPDKSGDKKDDFGDGSSVCIITLCFSNGAYHSFSLQKVTA